MALRVKQIVEQEMLKGTKIVAGMAGNNNFISWVNVMEILDTPDSVQKGELLVTTGYQLEDISSHGDLIKKLKERKVSGLAIQTGYYIDKIPQYIIEQGNIEQFPILELPTNLTFSAIMHVLMEQISAHTMIQEESEMLKLQKNVCNTMQKKCRLHLKDGEELYIFLIHSVDNQVNDKKEVAKGMASIKSYLESQAADRTCFYKNVKENEAVFCVILGAENTYHDVVFELRIKLTLLSEQQYVDYYVGVDRITEIEQINEAFINALECIHLFERIGARRGICSYDNIPFFELFARIQQNNRSILLGSESLQKLFAYDRGNQSQYVYTLRVYLAHECNASKAANRLFIHRHTLLNRLTKITNICQLQLFDYYTRLYLSLALLVHDFFAL